MSRSEQVYEVGLQQGLYTEDVQTFSVLPLSVRKALGDEFYKVDPTKLSKEEVQSYLVELKKIVNGSEATAAWSSWLRLPHYKGEKVVRKTGHSPTTLFEVFNKLYKREQHILSERSFSQQESQTAAVKEDQSALSEDGEVPGTTPDQDVQETQDITPPTLPQIVINSTPPASIMAPPLSTARSVANEKTKLMLQRAEQALPRPLTPNEVLDLITRRVRTSTQRK